MLAMTACIGRGTDNSEKDTDKASSAQEAPAFVYTPDTVMKELVALADNDEDDSEAATFIKSYYHTGGKPLIISAKRKFGIHKTLVNELAKMKDDGLNPNAFGMAEIAGDITRADSLEFDDSLNTADNVAARVEYRLAKAYLKYAAGQRFGFLKPHKLFNSLDKRPRSEDPTGKKFRILFSVNTEQADSAFFAGALNKLNSDSLTAFLKAVTPTDSLYLRLKQELAKTDSAELRMKLICNMERCRWRKTLPQNQHGKHIVVNIPAQHLYAFGGDSLLDMRIVCGTKSNKTPLLTSQIERMEVNPAWRVPTNIIKNELAYHAGDTAYFDKNRYVITSKETGDTMTVDSMTFGMLRSGKYFVTQERGPGNSLGRIVFRFPNPFSVYLHDTSSRSAFKRQVRTLSHGCVRVEKPFDLALYMLEGEDEWTLDKIRISMDIKPETEKGKKWLKDKKKELAGESNPPRYHALIKHKEVNPRIPLYIIYHTAYFDEKGELQTYPDRYGYDAIMSAAIKPLTE